MFNFQQSGYLKLLTVIFSLSPCPHYSYKTHKPAVLQGHSTFSHSGKGQRPMEVSRHITLVTKWPLRWLTGSLILVIRDLKVIVNVD